MISDGTVPNDESLECVSVDNFLMMHVKHHLDILTTPLLYREGWSGMSIACVYLTMLARRVHIVTNSTLKKSSLKTLDRDVQLECHERQVNTSHGKHSIIPG